MKKLGYALLCSAMVFGITACGSSDTSSKENSADEKEVEEQETKSEYGVNETADVDGVKYTVTGVERSAGFSYNTPESGKEYVIVSVTIENESDEKIDYNPYYFKMLNSQGQEESTAFVVDLENELNSGDLAVGGNVSGKLCFEEPAGDTGLKLNVYADIFSDEPTYVFNLNV